MKTARQHSLDYHQRDLYSSHVSLPRRRFGPDVPWAPLEREFAVRGMNPKRHVSEKAVYRYRESGTLPASSADLICCEVLNIHPFDVYGFDCYEFDPGAV